MWGFLVNKAWAHLQLSDFELAVKCAEQSSQSSPNQYWPHLVHASGLAHLGRIDAAHGALKRALMLNPNVSLSQLRKQRDDAVASVWNMFTDGLALAGFVEQ